MVRPQNEDAFFLANLTTDQRCDGAQAVVWEVGGRGALLAVSDGMGGAKAGEVASAIALEALFEGMRAGGAGGEEDVERLKHVVEEASRRVRAAAARPDRRGMGATLTAVFLCGSTAYIAEVGDSRAYLIRNGSICQVTHDQSFVQMLVDAGALTPEEAERSPQKNIIMQVMGQKDELCVALGRMELLRGDRLLLCSDGLSNMVEEGEMRRLAASPADLEAACAALVDAANRAGGKDNITVVLAEATGEGLRSARGAGQACPEAVEVVQPFKPALR